jgi:hypothetical protein
MDSNRNAVCFGSFHDAEAERSSHLTMFLLFSIGIFPITQCMDIMYIGGSWIAMLNITFEFPCFINILIYRLAKNRRVWRVLFPFLFLLLATSQFYIVWIYWVLNKTKFNSKDTQQSTVSTKPDSQEVAKKELEIEDGAEAQFNVVFQQRWRSTLLQHEQCFVFREKQEVGRFVQATDG